MQKTIKKVYLDPRIEVATISVESGFQTSLEDPTVSDDVIEWASETIIFED